MHAIRRAPIWRLLGLVLTFASLAVLTACGSESGTSSDSTAADTTAAQTQAADTTAADTADAKPLDGKTIAYIQTGSLDYYEYSANGAKLAVEALGGQAKIFNSELDTQKEQANVQDAITQGVDGIVIFPLSDASEKAAVRAAKRAGIPVSIVGIVALDDVQPDIVGNAAVNFLDYSKALGEAYAQVLPEGDIALITGAAGRKEVVDFSTGFAEGLGDPSRIVQEVDGQYMRQKAFGAAQDLIAKYPDLKGLVVGNEDMAVGAIKGLGAKASSVAVASQNGSPEGNKLLDEDKLKVTVGASPSQEAVLAVRLLADAVAGQPAADKVCYTPFAINRPGDIQSQPWEPTSELVDQWLTSECAGSDSA